MDLRSTIRTTGSVRSFRPDAVDDATVAAVLDDGPSPGGVASTVVDCTVDPPLIRRAGPLTAAQLGLEAG